MLRKHLAVLILSSAATLGCAQCQDCNDALGPVPESENYGTYDLGDRSGSVLSGTRVATQDGELEPTQVDIDVEVTQ